MRFIPVPTDEHGRVDRARLNHLADGCQILPVADMIAKGRVREYSEADIDPEGKLTPEERKRCFEEACSHDLGSPGNHYWAYP
jgi:hypothetical protein